MLNITAFQHPGPNVGQKGPTEPALATGQRTKPETNPEFLTGPREDQFQRHRSTVHFGSSMQPPGGGEDPLFRRSLGLGQDDEPIPGWDQAQALFQPVASQQTPTYTRWRTLPVLINNPELLQKIDRAHAKISAGASKKKAAKSEQIMKYWLEPPSDQQIAQANGLLKKGTIQPKVAKETSIVESWLSGLVSTRQTGFNNPELQARISKAREYMAAGDPIRTAAKKARISHTWLSRPSKQKLTLAQQYMREGQPQAEAAKMAGISQHWLAGESAKIKQKAVSENEASYSSTGLTDAVSRMELSEGRQQPHLSAKEALNYFKRYGALNPAFDARQHAVVMGHIASYAFSHPAQKEDALNKLSAYSASYNEQFPAVEHRLRTLGNDLYSGSTEHSEAASGSNSGSHSDTSLFSSVDISQVVHPQVIEVMGQNMYAHYDESGQFIGYFNGPQARE